MQQLQSASMPLYTATKRLLGTSLSSWLRSFVCTWNISKPAACACAHAVDHAKFKTTKIYSQGILVDYSKICTNENFPLYGIHVHSTSECSIDIGGQNHSNTSRHIQSVCKGGWKSTEWLSPCSGHQLFWIIWRRWSRTYQLRTVDMWDWDFWNIIAEVCISVNKTNIGV